MRFTVVTLFPEMFESFLGASLLGKAREAGILDVSFVDPREFATDKHRTVDDAPYGGGHGMVMKAPPLLAAIERAVGQGDAHRVLLTPVGAPLEQHRVRELARHEHLVLVCGRYEGIDQRVSDLAIDEELSIGDYVLTGGEPAAMVVIDAVARYVPGVLGEAASVEDESFSEPLLEYPQYTRPAEVEGRGVPAVLSSGNHAAVERWRRGQSLRRTADRRPDLMAARRLAPADEELLGEAGAEPLFRRTYVTLLHHPVLDPDGNTITTSVTNLDVHDIARSTATYGLAGYYLVTPISPQREQVQRVLENWNAGRGRGQGRARKPERGGPRRFDERGQALGTLETASSWQEVVEEITRRHGERPRIVATSARPSADAAVEPAALRRQASDSAAPLLLVFGTGHGLAAEVVEQSDQVLTPIWGPVEFNHLSVRSAVAAILDRLFGARS